MKQIGILTIHRIYNHGSFLQAFALKSTITDILNGEAKCEFIDWPIKNKSEEIYYEVPDQSVPSPHSLKFKLHRLLGHTQHCEDVEICWLNRRLGKIYTEQCRKYLGVTRTPNYNTNYDLIVVGSDESFNSAQDDAKWDGLFCYSFNKNQHIISYAASFGYSTVNRIEEYGQTKIVRDGLASYDDLSVRDENSRKLVYELTGRNPAVNLDPVLILDYTKYIPDINIRTDYILIYNYLKRICDKDSIDKIKDFAKKNRLRIISIFEYCPWADENLAVSSFEVLAYFKKAKYVITDTFHGAVMSIKFNKRFGVFVRESNYNKLHYLLSSFGLEGQIINSIELFPSVLFNDINWPAINKKIGLEKAKTTEYLSKNLNNI